MNRTNTKESRLQWAPCRFSILNLLTGIISSPMYKCISIYDLAQPRRELIACEPRLTSILRVRLDSLVRRMKKAWWQKFGTVFFSMSQRHVTESWKLSIPCNPWRRARTYHAVVVFLLRSIHPSNRISESNPHNLDEMGNLKVGPAEVRSSMLQAACRPRFGTCVFEFGVGSRLVMMDQKSGALIFPIFHGLRTSWYSRDFFTRTPAVLQTK